MFYLIFKSPIRFAQGWEDHRVVEEGLKIKKGDVLACILASGDNVLNLLRFKPEKIYAFEKSIEQIYEMKLKLTAIKNLSHTEFLILLGYLGKNNERVRLFNSISQKLDEDTYAFWKKHMRMIKKGFSFQGYWEKYSSSWRYPLKIFLGKNFNRYVNSESTVERKEIYEKHIYRPGLIFLSKFFKGPTLTKIVHINDTYYKNLPKNFEHYSYFWNVLEHFFVDIGCKGNPYHSWLLTKKMPTNEENWQPYLQKKNYEILRKNINRIIIVNKNIFDGLKDFEDNTFDGFYLSDVFDWMSEKEMENLLFEVIRVGKNRSRIIVFILNPKRNLPEKILSHVTYNKKVSRELWKKERVGLYSKIYSLEIKK